MNISWVVANSAILAHDVDIERLKNIGPIWGGWSTWRNCSTDNVICNDTGQARDLIKRQFHTLCNFYIPKLSYSDLDRPAGVKLYEGQFGFDLDRHDEIIAMHLAASQSDIVLLYGFDWTPKDPIQDRLLEHRAQNYRDTIYHAIADNNDTQWVLIDHAPELLKILSKLDNLTVDSLANVLDMFNG